MGDANQSDALDERLGRIEETLSRIEEHLGALSGQPPVPSPSPEAPPKADPESEPTPESAPETREPQAPAAPTEPQASEQQAPHPSPEGHAPAEPVRPAAAEQPTGQTGIAVENWLDKIGIGLLLLGLGFLFKLSVELGLLTEPVKVGLGLVVGASLGAAGWRARTSRRRLSQILMGGSSAAFYITLFAAHQIYELLGQAPAFAGMCAVTMATFLVAVRQRDPALALVGALGGFSTPFLLSSGTGNFVGLSLYNAVLVSGMCAIVLMRGFKSLLAVTALGGWLVAVLTVLGAVDPASSSVIDGIFVQLGVLTVWLSVGVVPIWRVWLVRRVDAEQERADESAAQVMLVHALTLASPFIALLLTRLLWELPTAAWDAGYVALAGVYFASSFALDRAGAPGLSSNVRAVAGLLLTVAIGDFFSMDNWPVVFAMEAVALGWAARSLDEATLRLGCHALTTAAAIWLAASFFEGGAVDGAAFFNTHSARAAGVIGSILAVSFILRNDAARVMYRYIVHGLALLYLHDQATLAAHGDILATACWGVYAIALIVGGLSMASRQLKYVGLATVLLAVAKLLIVDMAGTETVWRVLLFLGFGGALLAVSYVAPLLGGEAAEE